MELYIFIPPSPLQSRLNPTGIKPDVLEGVPVEAYIPLFNSFK